MRTILMVLGLLFASVHSATAGNFVEGFRRMQDGGKAVDGIDTYLTKRFEKSDFGASAFLLVTHGWAEGYVGPTYAPTDWSELSLSVGGEQMPDGLGWRYAAGLWIGTGPWSFLASFEANNDVFRGDDLGLWYDFTGTYEMISWLRAGVRDRRFVGAGPHVVGSIPSTPLSLWLTWTPVDPEGLAPTDLTRFLVGSQIAF